MSYPNPNVCSDLDAVLRQRYRASLVLAVV